MNPNWRLVTTDGVFAVKLVRDASPAEARRQHRLLPLLAERGLPVPPVRRTRDGDSLAEVDGDWYAMTGWLPGTHRSGLRLGLAGCRALGALLGNLHAALRDLQPRTPPSLTDDPRRVEDTVAALDRYARAAAARRDDFDVFAMADIAWRRRLLDRVREQRPPTRAVQPVGWTHGDLNNLNLLFDGETVSGLLDWDRLGPRPYGLEVVRTATLMFGTGDRRGVDLPRVTAFADGYRSRMTIGDEALRDAAHRRWWTLATDTWFLRLHYDSQDPSCDHLLRRSSSLLHWWTTHRETLDAALTRGPEDRSPQSRHSHLGRPAFGRDHKDLAGGCLDLP